MPNQFIFGYGFLGRRLAQQFLAAGDQVWTVTRNREKADQLTAHGIVARVADHRQWSDLAADPGLPPFQSITVCVGNDGQAETDHTTVYTSATEAAVVMANRAMPRHTSAAMPTGTSSRILFVSTTGVYRSDPAANPPIRPNPAAEPRVVAGYPIIDEHAPVGAQRAGAAASLRCESLLHQQPAELATVFRLAGIYALERIPNLARLRAQEPIPGSAEGLLNLIHVEDAARILATAAAAPPPWPVVNVADGQPVQRRTFYEFLAKKYQLATPQFTEAGGRSGVSKQIDTTRLRQWYQGPWRYPDYRLGLADSTVEEEGAFRV